MTSVERGLREASGDRHPYSRTAVAGMWMFCKRLSCRHCEEAGFLICSEGASGEHTCPGFVSMSTLPYSGRRAGSFSAPLLRAFLCANSLMDSRAFGSVMSRETLGLSPYARKGKVVHSSQEAVRSTCLRRRDILTRSVGTLPFDRAAPLPQPSGGLPAHEAWHRLARSASSQGAGPSFFSGLPRGSSHPPTVDGCSCSSQKQPQEASEFIRMEECGKPLSSDLFGCPR